MIRAEHVQSMITPIKRRDIFVKENNLILKKDIFFSVAHGNKNYRICVDHKIIPLPPIYNVFWVVVKVNKNTGKPLIHFLDKDPTKYGDSFPSNPQNGDLFFNTQRRKSFMYIYGEWIEDIRINLCKIENGRVEKIYNSSSQVGLENVPHIAGDIQLLKGLKPIIVDTQNGFFLITDNDILLKDLDNGVKLLNLEGVTARHIAEIDLQKNDLVMRSADNKITKATNFSVSNPVIAIVLSDCASGEECFIKEVGYIDDVTWRWPNPPNTKIYCDSRGKITTIPDWNTNSIQEVGYIVDVDTIYFDPRPQIVLMPSPS